MTDSDLTSRCSGRSAARPVAESGRSQETMKNRQWVVVAVSLVVGLAVPVAARAEFPAAVSVVVGVGPMTSSYGGDSRTWWLSAVFSAQVAWRAWPGRSVTATYQRGEAGGGLTSIPGDSGPHGVSYTAYLAGMEFSKPGPGVRGYLEVAAGVGSVAVDVRPDTPPRAGPALSGTAGLRLTPAEGGAGLLVGIRSSHVFAAGSRAHSPVALFLGFTVRPN